MQDLNWNDLRHVLAVARSGLLSTAAQRLGVNETTVSRRIAHIEKTLGTRLFHRSEGQLLPTEAGEIVVAHAEHVELEIDRLQGSVAGTDAVAAGTVRLTSVPIIVNRILAPALRSLLERHPAIRIELIAEPRDLSLTKRDADMALRLARPHKEQRILARRVGELGYAVFALPRRSAHALPWITYEEGMAGLPQASWIAGRLKRQGEKESVVAVNDAETLLHAIKAGLGKSLLPCVIGDREPGLCRLSGPTPVLSRELWLLVHPELRPLARINAVIEWLQSTLKARSLNA